MAAYFYRHPHRHILAAKAVVVTDATAAAAEEVLRATESINSAAAASRGAAPLISVRAVYYEACGSTMSHWWHYFVGHIKEGVSRKLLLQLLRGLAHMHHHGVAHRDIKPSNFMIDIDADPEPVWRLNIGDFGWNRGLAADPGNMTPDVVTPVYRAPEVWLGQPYSFPVDVWSVGLIARELFTGWRLYQLMDVIVPGADIELGLCRAAGGVIDERTWPGSASNMTIAYHGVQLARLN